MKKTMQTPARQAGPDTAQAMAQNAPQGAVAAQLHQSPRMVAQRQQLDGAFGAATQLAGIKKKPMQHKADPAAGPLQLQGNLKKKHK